jgi:hypothetical protein
LEVCLYWTVSQGSGWRDRRRVYFSCVATSQGVKGMSSHKLGTCSLFHFDRI